MNILIYEGKNGTRVDLKSQGIETMWATQKQMAEIFDVEIPAISKHISNILNDGESDISVISKMEITASDGKKYNVEHYNLDIIIAVGYRVNSAKATHFRIWATKILKEYIIKGFAMDDERLKDPSKNQYFEELLERIRDIRASEKLFYQKIRDIFTTAIDYDKQSDKAKEFFKIVQNKMLYAICGKTAPELIISRINAGRSVFRKQDIDIAKNYLYKEEVEGLNRLTTMLLEYAEDQAKRKKALTMQDWMSKVDNLIAFNDYKVLETAGKTSHDNMKKFVSVEYQKFDDKRKEIEKREAEEEAIEDLRKIEEEVKEILKSK